MIGRTPDRVVVVRDFMQRKRLRLSDLTDIGGEDMRDARAKAVANCWCLMAELGVEHDDLETSATGDKPTTWEY